MADELGRQLQRDYYNDPGDVAAQARLLRSQLQTGTIPRRNVEIAAALGYEIALELAEPADLDPLPAGYVHRDGKGLLRFYSSTTRLRLRAGWIKRKPRWPIHEQLYLAIRLLLQSGDHYPLVAEMYESIAVDILGYHHDMTMVNRARKLIEFIRQMPHPEVISPAFEEAYVNWMDNTMGWVGYPRIDALSNLIDGLTLAASGASLEVADDRLLLGLARLEGVLWREQRERWKRLRDRVIEYLLTPQHSGSRRNPIGRHNPIGEQGLRLAERRYHESPTGENYQRFCYLALQRGTSVRNILGPAAEDRVLAEAQRIMRIDQDTHIWHEQLSSMFNISYVRMSEDDHYLDPVYGIHIEFRERVPTETWSDEYQTYVIERNDFAITIDCSFPLSDEYEFEALQTRSEWTPEHLPHLRLVSQHLLNENDRESMSESNWRPPYSRWLYRREQGLRKLFCHELRQSVHTVCSHPNESPFVHPTISGGY